MNTEEKKRYMVAMRRGYRPFWSKAKKGEYIGKIVEATGYDRKVVIRLLKRQESPPCKLGAPKKLNAADIDLLRQIWKMAGCICAQYLHKALRFWLDDIGRLPGGAVPEAQRKRLLAVSYKTMERELKTYRIEAPVKNESYGVKAAAKAGIELVATIRVVHEPGHICIDTVAHCGSTLQGDFIWTLTWTDIYTGFTLTVAIWNKGYAGIEEALLYCIRHTPFPIIYINTDNGSEFLNHHLFAFWK